MDSSSSENVIIKQTYGFVMSTVSLFSLGLARWALAQTSAAHPSPTHPTQGNCFIGQYRAALNISRETGMLQLHGT